MKSAALQILYSVGHGNRSEAEFVALLRAHGVTRVADVRAYPSSRRHPQFSRANLEYVLKESAIDYFWIGDALGGLRTASHESIQLGLTSPAMRAYADHMNSRAFRAGAERLRAHARQAPAAMMCAERSPQQCHRALISDYLTAQGVTVIHLLDAATSVEHRLHPALRVTVDKLIYDRGADQQLASDW